VHGSIGLWPTRVLIQLDRLGGVAARAASEIYGLNGELLRGERDVMLVERLDQDEMSAIYDPVYGRNQKRLMFGGEGVLDLQCQVQKSVFRAGDIVYLALGVRNATKRKVRPWRGQRTPPAVAGPNRSCKPPRARRLATARARSTASCSSWSSARRFLRRRTPRGPTAAAIGRGKRYSGHAWVDRLRVGRLTGWRAGRSAMEWLRRQILMSRDYLDRDFAVEPSESHQLMIDFDLPVRHSPRCSWSLATDRAG